MQQYVGSYLWIFFMGHLSVWGFTTPLNSRFNTDLHLWSVENNISSKKFIQGTIDKTPYRETRIRPVLDSPVHYAKTSMIA